MKNQLILLLVIMHSLTLTSLWAQCVDDCIISTNPDAPRHECTQYDSNVFDWRTPTFTTTNPALPNGVIPSPYWQEDNATIHFCTFNPALKNH